MMKRFKKSTYAGILIAAVMGGMSVTANAAEMLIAEGLTESGRGGAFDPITGLITIGLGAAVMFWWLWCASRKETV